MSSRILADIAIGAITLNVIQLFDTMKASQFHENSADADYLLTVRETECLRWVAAGKTSSEIAQITGLSEHTVNHYLSSSCRKLDAVNRIQAAVKAVRASLI